MVYSLHSRRRLCFLALAWPLLIVSWATLSLSSSLLQVAIDELLPDSITTASDEPLPADDSTTATHQETITITTSKQEPPIAAGNNEDSTQRAKDPPAINTTTTKDSTQQSDNSTTTPHSATAPPHSLFPLEFATWKLPSAWTAPWNDTNDEDEIDYGQYEDEKTYLDIFGEVAKEFLTQRVIPSTDAECDWNWKHLRCEPYCHCELYPMWGDYHIGRTCRRRDGPPPLRHPPSTNMSAAEATPPPALSPCEFDGDLPSPLSRVKKLVRDQLDEVTPLVKATVDQWQQKLEELLQSPKSIEAQRAVLLWLRLAHYKLYKLQTEACANVPCPGSNDDVGTNVTKPTDASTTAAADRRPPGPWAWSQRFLCDKLPFSDKCNNGNNVDEGQRRFPWPPEEEYYFDARPKTSRGTEKGTPKPSTAGTPQPPPTFHRFTGWAKKD